MNLIHCISLLKNTNRFMLLITQAVILVFQIKNLMKQKNLIKDLFGESIFDSSFDMSIECKTQMKFLAKCLFLS